MDFVISLEKPSSTENILNSTVYVFVSKLKNIRRISSVDLRLFPVSSQNLGRNSFDFAVNRFLFKLFKTSNVHIVNDVLLFFGFKLPSELIINHVAKFELHILLTNNLLCRVFSTTNNDRLDLSFVYRTE